MLNKLVDFILIFILIISFIWKQLTKSIINGEILTSRPNTVINYCAPASVATNNVLYWPIDQRGCHCQYKNQESIKRVVVAVVMSNMLLSLFILFYFIFIFLCSEILREIEATDKGDKKPFWHVILYRQLDMYYGSF